MSCPRKNDREKSYKNEKRESHNHDAMTQGAKRLVKNIARQFFIALRNFSISPGEFDENGTFGFTAARVKLPERRA
jgi:hypothetical protein